MVDEARKPDDAPLAENAPTPDAVKTALRQVKDPEVGLNIVDLGLIYDCKISKLPDDSRYVYVEMTLTAPGCGMGDVLIEDVKEKIGIIPTVGKVDVELVLDVSRNGSDLRALYDKLIQATQTSYSVYTERLFVVAGGNGDRRSYHVAKRRGDVIVQARLTYSAKGSSTWGKYAAVLYNTLSFADNRTAEDKLGGLSSVHSD